MCTDENLLLECTSLKLCNVTTKIIIIIIIIIIITSGSLTW